MNLEEVLRAVECGESGQEHAEWLREFCDWDKNLTGKALERVYLRDEQITKARADAVKVALECRNLAQQLAQAVSLVSLYEVARDSHDLAMWHRDEARTESVQVALECQELERERQAFADTCDRYYAQIEILTQERDEWRQGALDEGADKDDAEENYRSARQSESRHWDRQTAAEAERDELQAELEEATATNKIFGDCVHRAGIAYREGHPEMPDGEWPDGAQAFTWWVGEMQAELEKTRLDGDKSHAAWFREQERVEELREELRGECAHNELLQSEMVTMSHEVDELEERLLMTQSRLAKDALLFHEIQDTLVDQRNEARAELKDRDVELAAFRSGEKISRDAAVEWEKLQAEVDALKAELADEGTDPDFYVPMPPKSVTEVQIVPVEKRCETCRHIVDVNEELGMRAWCKLESDECAPNGFREWEAKP